MEFEIAPLQHRVGSYGELQHSQAVLLVEQLKVLLQGILWTHHHPHLIDQPLLADVGGKGGVAEVYGIEGASEDSDSLHAIYFSINSLMMLSASA